MRQYELAIRIAQVHHLVDERKYKKALAVIQTIDMRQVRALSDLKVFAEVYTKTEQYDAAKATYLRIYRRSRTKRVLYRLIYLSIRTNALNDAEAYYQEFVRMNPNARDALILRYRLDKASGASMDKLIDILQELKQEEYIEEWAYELAKLYHRAGRREECKEECEDIILWFGTGEIVERARILIDHLEEGDSGLYYDDKDFTVPKKEEPNPEDTGSLPDLKEFIREKKAHKKDEHREGRHVEREHEEEREEEKFAGEEEHTKKETLSEDDFVDDYEDDIFGEGDMDLPQKAKDGIHKLSGLFKIGKKEEGENGSSQGKEQPSAAELVERLVKAEKLERMGQPEPEKYLNQGENAQKRERQTRREMPQKEGETASKEDSKQEDALQATPKSAPVRKTEPAVVLGNGESPRKSGGEDEVKIGFVPHSQSGMGITQDLAKEIAAIYEMEHREQLKEKAVTVIHDTSNFASSVVDRMTQAVQKNIGKGYIPLDIEEIQPEDEVTVQGNQGLASEGAELIEAQGAEQKEIASIREGAEGLPEAVLQTDMEEAEGEPEGALETIAGESMPEAVSDKEMRERALTEMLEEEEEEIQDGLTEEQIAETARRDTETLKNLMEEEIRDPEPEESSSCHEMEEPSVSHEEEEGMLEEEASVSREGVLVREKAREAHSDQEPSQEQTSGLAGYQALDIPVVETEYMEMPEITYEDLPTTRALQQSFKNVLKLIAGELDPSHFVLMGDGSERIVGVSKQIVRVMKETGYLSRGRIAKIHAKQINMMDLISFRSQLKGNCLLIEEASDLLFPTITRLFSIMEEYYGDFVVILVDEGTTLDQLFRFVPALAKKFKYIIDISGYAPEEFQ